MILAAVMAIVLIGAGCGSNGDDDEDLQSSPTSDQADGTATSETTTTTTEPTTSSTETTLSPAAEDEALRDELMAFVLEHRKAYRDCLAELEACDVERDLGDHIAGQLRTEIVTAAAGWRADGLRFRGTDPAIFYRRHGSLVEDPPTWALEVCVMAFDAEIFTIGDDGSESIVQAADPSPSFQQYVIEELGDGSWRIIRSFPNESDVIEGDSCESYDE